MLSGAFLTLVSRNSRNSRAFLYFTIPGLYHVWRAGINQGGLLRYASPHKTCFCIFLKGIQMILVFPCASRAVYCHFLLSWACAPLRQAENTTFVFLRLVVGIVFCLFLSPPPRQDENNKRSPGAFLYFPFPGLQRARRAGINQGGPAPMGIPSQNLFHDRL